MIIMNKQYALWKVKRKGNKELSGKRGANKKTS